MSLLLPEQRLNRAFYAQSPQTVAQALLGAALLRRDGRGTVCGGWIVETEAYLATDDPASHSYRGQTPRNASMFADAGTLYVYSIHAKFCLNAVTEAAGVGSAVLIRALEPVWGVTAMQQRRGIETADRRLTGGPARLCQALGISKRDDGCDLTAGGEIWIAPPATTHRLGNSARIGVSSATHLAMRYFVDRNMFVSGPRGVHSARATERIQWKE